MTTWPGQVLPKHSAGGGTGGIMCFLDFAHKLRHCFNNRRVIVSPQAELMRFGGGGGEITQNALFQSKSRATVGANNLDLEKCSVMGHLQDNHKATCLA